MSPKGAFNSLFELIAFRKPEKQGIEREVFMASIRLIPLKNGGPHMATADQVQL